MAAETIGHLRLTRNAQPFCRRAGGDNQRLSRDGVRVRVELKGTLGEVDLGDPRLKKFSSKPLGLLAKFVHKLRPVDSV
jgi:hypothetical protein